MKNLKAFSLAITMLISYLTFSQERTIIGTVSDKNEKLPFVTVNIKGTQKAVQTDFDGKFSIKAKKGDKLIFSFLGYDNYEQEIGEKVSEYQIILKSNAVLLEETYGGPIPINRRKNLEQKTISVEELEKPVVEKDTIISKERESNLVNALSSKIQGVTITNSSGSKNSSSRIVLKCKPTIIDENEALYVVDEKISNKKDIENINPDTIESISVLKGKDATVLYGTQGKNGVILIKTKKLSKKELKNLKKFSIKKEKNGKIIIR